MFIRNAPPRIAQGRQALLAYDSSDGSGGSAAPVSAAELPATSSAVRATAAVGAAKEHVRSSAAIRCLLYMKWNWKWIFPFAWIIPLPIRDLLYYVIAKLRFREA